MSYIPQNHYWLADDGRVYAGPTQTVVTKDDAGYRAWLSVNNRATPWPRDNGGNQTSAALQEVLAPYGMFADLAAYAADVRWRKEVGGTTITGVAYPTDRDTQGKLTSAFVLASADPSATFKWKLPDGTFTPSIDATNMQAVAKAVGQFVNGCFSTEETVVKGINAGTITTRGQVDTAFAA